jgi:hypothetical protein
MNLILKLLGTGVSIAAGLAGAKLIDFAWKAVTGKESPKQDTDAMENTLRATVVFALISGGVSAMIRVLSQRGTQHAINRFTKTRDLV